MKKSELKKLVSEYRKIKHKQTKKHRYPQIIKAVKGTRT